MKNKRLIVPALALLGVTAFTGSTAYAMNQNRRNPILTETQQSILEEVRELRREGNYDEANELIDENGLYVQKGNNMKLYKQKRFEEFIDSEDYDSFIGLTKETRMGEAIDTEDKFETLIEAHKLRESGDHEGARALMENAGLSRDFKVEKTSRNK